MTTPHFFLDLQSYFVVALRFFAQRFFIRSESRLRPSSVKPPPGHWPELLSAAPHWIARSCAAPHIVASCLRRFSCVPLHSWCASASSAWCLDGYHRRVAELSLA